MDVKFSTHTHISHLLNQSSINYNWQQMYTLKNKPSLFIKAIGQLANLIGSVHETAIYYKCHLLRIANEISIQKIVNL